MSETKNEKIDESNSSGRSHRSNVGDPLDSTVELTSSGIPQGVDRRAFLMRSAMIGAMSVITGVSISCEEKTEKAARTTAETGTAPTPPLSPDLDVVTREKGPVLTLIDEFYKVGPGPSSSHTIGPMRITYDFYQRATKLPADRKTNSAGSGCATAIPD